MNKAFSLIELMVTIAIIAVLAAIAVPTYQKYSIRASIIPQVQILKSLGDYVVMSYNRTGSLPASIPYKRGVIPSGGWLCLDYNTIRSYGDPVLATVYSQGINPGTFTIWLGLQGGTYDQIPGAGLAGSCTPVHKAIGMVWDMSGPDVKVYCGGGGYSGIDSEYLPSDCKTDLCALGLIGC